MSDSQKVIAYYRAIYEIPSEGVRLNIGSMDDRWARFLKIRKTSTYAIISPDNPGSERLSEGENSRRRKQFRKRLTEDEPLDFLSGENLDPEDGWPPEISFVLFDIDISAAYELAETFDQDAFVYGFRDIPPFLIWTEPPLK